jgi:hypothetical protein
VGWGGAAGGGGVSKHAGSLASGYAMLCYAYGLLVWESKLHEGVSAALGWAGLWYEGAIEMRSLAIRCRLI